MQRMSIALMMIRELLPPWMLFQMTFAALTRRNLMRPEDEAVCLATTVSPELVEAVLHEPDADGRMRIFLKALGRLPLAILFLETKRQPRPDPASGGGRSWMPRTLMCPGPRDVPRYVEVRSDGRLSYDRPALLADRPFAVEAADDGDGRWAGLRFALALPDGGARLFVGVHPQPGVEKAAAVAAQGTPSGSPRRRYVVVPSGPLTRDNIPQRVVVLSVCGGEADQESGPLQTCYEFVAWVFHLSLLGDEHFKEGETRKYHVWLPPRKHYWHVDLDTLEVIPFTHLSLARGLLIE